MGVGKMNSLHNLRKYKMSKRNMLLALAALLLAAGSAYAQNDRFNVPFQFAIGKSVMPAGHYSIKSASPTSGALIIQDRQTGRSSGFVAGIPIRSRGAQDQTKLVFHCYSGSCFLSQVWTGNDVGRQLTESSQELELAKQSPAVRVPVVAALP
jgi:hypothetical protein